MRDKYHHTPRIYDVKTTPFENAEEAWFWFMLAQQAKNDGARAIAGQALIPRACEPNDILAIVSRLHRQRRLLMDHLRVLRHYGLRRMAPDPRRPREARSWCLWYEAMERLEPVFIAKGIVRNDEEPTEDMVEFLPANVIALSLAHRPQQGRGLE
jgi:hypothetical protein